MPRPAESIHDIIDAAAQRVANRIVPLIQRAIAGAAPSGAPSRKPDARGSVRARRRPPPQELTRWVADRRARRVPTFVIDLTGLDTKKKIVAKFGENAAFEKGKPLPPSKSMMAAEQSSGRASAAARVVKAKSPIVRKGAAK